MSAGCTYSGGSRASGTHGAAASPLCLLIHATVTRRHYPDRKQWQAVEIVAGHVKEVVLLVLAMLERGDEVGLSRRLRTMSLQPASNTTTTHLGPPSRSQPPFIAQATAELGGKVFDALFRDRDLVDVIPKLAKMWEPGRFSSS